MGSKGSARERLAVIVICFGYLTVASIFSVVLGHRHFDYTNTAVATVLILEIAFTLAALLVLRHHGWKFGDIGFHISLKSTIVAIALFVSTYVVYSVVYVVLLHSGVLHGWSDITVRFVASPVLILPFLIVNSVFEELFVVGYLIEATPGTEAAFAVSVSALVRLLYHTYQGPLALASILPLGILFAVAYARWRNLWPLVVAHTAFNVIGWATT